MEKEYFETAPRSELCNCVGVILTEEQGEIIDRRPEWTSRVVMAAMHPRKQQQRTREVGCRLCGGTGVKTS